MNQLDNINFLCQKLTEINKKYESNTFVDIDFIDLFGLHSSQIKSIDNIDQIKKKLTTKYYSLALKYHPDKVKFNDNIVNIKNCFINIDDLKSGQFLSFINDIYDMLKQMIDEDTETLINLINGNHDDILNKFDINLDHFQLKNGYSRNSILSQSLQPSETIINDFKKQLDKIKISEIKIDEDQIRKLIDNELEKRDEINIDNMFTDDQKKSTDFKTIFNETFDNEKNVLLNEDDVESSCYDVQPVNYNSNLIVSDIDAYSYINSKLSNTTYDIQEAFAPLKISTKLKNKNKLSYGQYIEERDNQDKLFKIPNKSNNDNIIKMS